MDKEEEKLNLSPYTGNNGIDIYCRQCGDQMEETGDGYYLPVVYESDKHDRDCYACRIADGYDQ